MMQQLQICQLQWWKPRRLFSAEENHLLYFYVIRELVPPPEMIPSDARQMHMGPHLGPPLPPHANVLPGRAYPGAGEHGRTRSCLQRLEK